MRLPAAISSGLGSAFLAVGALAQPADPENPSLPAEPPESPKAAVTQSAREPVTPSSPVLASPAAASPAEASTIEGRQEAPKNQDAKNQDAKNQDAKNRDAKNDLLVGVDGGYGRLKLGGRVFARAAFSSREFGDSQTDSLGFSVSSARLDLFYEAPIEWLSADVEFDISGNPEMKDAFLQAKGRHFWARVGQFKSPISAIEMESPWTLPLADRGFLNDLLLDYLDVAGRRPGVLIGWRGRGGIKPRLSVGVFQGSVMEEAPDDNNPRTGDRDVAIIREWRQRGSDWNQSLFDAQGLASRFELELGRVSLGAYYQHRVGSPSQLRTKHYPTAGIDLVFAQKESVGGVRVWADLIFGASWYENQNKAPDTDDPVFLSGRLLGAYRFGGTFEGEPYLEPFGMFGGFDPDLDFESDFAWEGVLGLNAGYWKVARLTLQGEINRAAENFPNHTSGYLFGLNPNRLGVTLQVGMAF